MYACIANQPQYWIDHKRGYLKLYLFYLRDNIQNSLFFFSHISLFIKVMVNGFRGWVSIWFYIWMNKWWLKLKNIRRLGHEGTRDAIPLGIKSEELNENFGFLSCHLVPTHQYPQWWGRNVSTHGSLGYSMDSRICIAYNSVIIMACVTVVINYMIHQIKFIF